MMLLLARLEALEDKVVAFATQPPILRLGTFLTAVAGGLLWVFPLNSLPYKVCRTVAVLGGAMGIGTGLGMRRDPQVVGK